MAITLVGTPQVGGAPNGGNVTLTFDGTPAENDVAVVFGGHSQTATGEALGPSTAGYTALLATQTGGNALGVWYKKMGAMPDANVVCQGNGMAQDATAYGSYMLRGVDQVAASDQTPTEGGPSTVNPPDNAAITTVTDAAWVILAALYRDQANDANWLPSAAPTGYSNLATIRQADTRTESLAAATKEVSPAGADDPAAWSWGQGTPEWYAITVAIRPAGAAVFDLDRMERYFGRGYGRGYARSMG